MTQCKEPDQRPHNGEFNTMAIQNSHDSNSIYEEKWGEGGKGMKEEERGEDRRVELR